MSSLLAARLQMAVSLGFHIIFAAIGMTLPFFMAVSHWGWIKKRDKTSFALTKAWSKGTAIFFAVGAVSGTVLSFELGLLWPKFMEHAGPIIGMPFSWEGTAFFLEAIALGIFLYGWEKLPIKIHWLSGVVVGICGVVSGLFVVCANAWMNTPRGFDWVDGKAINIDPWAAMFNPASFVQGFHMIFAAFAATGFAVAAVHAFGVLQNPQSEIHKKAFKIALIFGSVAAIIQPFQGDRLAKTLAQRQPEKLAAMESLFKTEKPASLLIGGIPSEKDETVRFGVHVPKLLSLLAHGDLNSEVKGLESFSKDTWPPVLPVHFSFQIMVALGTFLFLIATLSLFLLYKKSTWLEKPSFLKLIILSGPLGFLAIEAGWVVTEVGRQPWIIYQIMKTKDAVSPMPGLVYTMIVVFAIYSFLTFLVTWLMMRQYKNVS